MSLTTYHREIIQKKTQGPTPPSPYIMFSAFAYLYKSACLLLQPMADTKLQTLVINFSSGAKLQVLKQTVYQNSFKNLMKAKYCMEDGGGMGPGFSSVYSFLDSCILLSRGCCGRCLLIRVSSWARCSPALTAFHSATTQWYPKAMLTPPSPTQHNPSVDRTQLCPIWMYIVKVNKRSCHHLLQINLKGTQAWHFFKYFFCRNRNLMVPRACNTRFLKIVFDSAEIFNF